MKLNQLTRGSVRVALNNAVNLLRVKLLELLQFIFGVKFLIFQVDMIDIFIKEEGNNDFSD